ncbi:hypothetical protein QTA58_02515 [Neorhizobium sp. CSC1952]|uniref:hypothetical protein n=1 Tax=Neorhizobium sp. CSC1952 TaxID=2978974 RepID=UPI0025A4DF25|nr:hypothetical protein [Rhizobium sp. CSC1952]WJR67658.1 hypothetical protein QTA58_02515 [Rhizobium sp. CSC1952]
MSGNGAKFGADLAEAVKGYVARSLADFEARHLELARRVSDLEERMKAEKPRVRVPVGSERV